jgi:hypothetical protein
LGVQRDGGTRAGKVTGRCGCAEAILVSAKLQMRRAVSTRANDIEVHLPLLMLSLDVHAVLETRVRRHEQWAKMKRAIG